MLYMGLLHVALAYRQEPVIVDLAQIALENVRVERKREATWALIATTSIVRNHLHL
jgi:hypothetical protein